MGKLYVENVSDVLKNNEIISPIFPFLTVAPDHLRIALFQPVAVVEAIASRVGPKDRDAMAEKMLEFMRRAASESIDIAACPEYSCPWTALCEAVENDITPPAGKLWAIACESATVEEFTIYVAKLREKINVIFDESALQQHGDFLNSLCYLFIAKTAEGQDVTIALIQFKTAPMGDKEHFEYSHLKLGNVLYRFQNQAGRLGVVTLLCSDALNPGLSDVIDKLRRETLILHLQFNHNPVAETFRKYRTDCCNYSPRNTEILCLNWGRGTVLEMAGKEIFKIPDPRTALYRLTDELLGTDERIHENHAKGCFLTRMENPHTSTLIFAPDEYYFCFETTKPYVEGYAQTTARTGPRMLTLRSWNADEKSWKEVSGSPDHFETYVKTRAPSVYGVLSPLWERPLDAERLMQLSTGHAKEANWHHWKELRSFTLATDETSGRLSLGWSLDGAGEQFRSPCFSKFQALHAEVMKTETLPVRLANFADGHFNLTFKSDDKKVRFCNLHSENGRTGTAIYLGDFPPEQVRLEVKKRTQKGLQDTGAQDAQALAIWYRNGNGLIDMMADDIPQIADDPCDNPTSITNTTL